MLLGCKKKAETQAPKDPHIPSENVVGVLSEDGLRFHNQGSNKQVTLLNLELHARLHCSGYWNGSRLSAMLHHQLVMISTMFFRRLTHASTIQFFERTHKTNTHTNPSPQALAEAPYSTRTQSPV